MQRAFPFLSITAPPKLAPDDLVARIKSDAQAVAVTLIGMKASYVASQLRISAPYLSQIAHGVKPVPDWFITPFCALTGSNLLAQHRDTKNSEASENKRLAAWLRRAA